jgi:hypothetical protein
VHQQGCSKIKGITSPWQWQASHIIFNAVLQKLKMVLPTIQVTVRLLRLSDPAFKYSGSELSRHFDSSFPKRVLE